MSAPTSASAGPAGATNRFGIGQAVRRVEDRRFVTGQGRYVDDITVPRCAYGYVVRSPHAHARILARGVDAARQAPGVLCVLTGQDVVADGLAGFTASAMPEDLGAPPGHRTFRPVLATDKARFAGEAVAFIVADTPAQAVDAAELVDLDYEPLPAVTRPDDAAAATGSFVHEDCPGGNIAWGLMFGDAAATDAAFAAAPHRVAVRLDNSRLSANPIEPRGCIGEYDAASRSYTLHTSTQNPHGVRQEVCGVLGITETRLRVVGPDVGGGFGMKADAYPEDALVLWAARKCGRPVKWIATRSEGLLSDTGGRDQVADGELAWPGGHSLLPLMRLRFAAPAALVDIQDLRDLRFVTRDGDRVRVGALTRHRDLEADPVIRESVPLLSAVAGEIGDVQIRNRGTIGGSVAHADPAGEYPTVCLMLDAEIVTSRRRIAAAEFFLGRFTTPLADDELITELVFPVTEGRPAYTKFCHRLFDWALVGAAAQRTRHGWRVGLVNVSDTPVRVRGVEQALDAGAGHAEAARLASEGLAPTPALRASAEYKLHLTRVLTRRVIETAAGA